MGWNELIGAHLGEFIVIGEIARGGMSRVYRASDPLNEREVAIKVMAMGSDNGDPRTFTKRFEHEARAVKRLDHPNIVKVYSTGETDEFVYIVMQLVTGGTYRSRLGKPLTVSEACAMAIQMAQALAHAHRNNVIHRDVKPANILIDDQDPQHLLLADFGIAKIIGQKGVTKTGTAVGTPEYMAPEQAKGEEIDPRADIYGLACVLYEALAGRPPFVGPTALSICYQHVHTRPAYIRGFNPEVPRPLALIIEQALAKNPNDRFVDAASFAEALHPFTEPTGLVVRRSRPNTAPLRDLDLRGTADAIGMGLDGDPAPVAQDPLAYLIPASLEPIAPLSAPSAVAPMLDLSQLPPEAPLPAIHPDDVTTRQTQEMMPMATPARARHTHPTNPGLRLKSRPLTTPHDPERSNPDVAGLSTAMTPIAAAGPDVASYSTVRSPVAAATPPGTYPPSSDRPMRKPSMPLSATASSSSFITLQPHGRRLLALVGLGIAATLIILLIINRISSAQPTSTAIATPTATAVPITDTPTGVPTTPTISVAAQAIPRATLSNAQDGTCNPAYNRTRFALGVTVVINTCIAAGFGPGTVTISLFDANGNTLSRPPLQYQVSSRDAAFFYYTYGGIPAGNFRVEILWNNQVAQTLPLTIGP